MLYLREVFGKQFLLRRANNRQTAVLARFLPSFDRLPGGPEAVCRGHQRRRDAGLEGRGRARPYPGSPSRATARDPRAASLISTDQVTGMFGSSVSRTVQYFVTASSIARSAFATGMLSPEIR